MISTRQLAYRYTDGPELCFDDIEVAQGGIVLLRGASGSGKSTWLALAAGLLAPGGGDITVAGQSLKALGRVASDAWRASNIGFLPQKLHLSAALTVHDNLAMAQWSAGQPPDMARITEALTALDVHLLAGRKPAQLSGGQAQRVALARAVLLKPKVILADEPTASLDDSSARASLALLRATARRTGATLVIATHDSRVESLFGDEIGLLPIYFRLRQL
ncbi:MAG: ATP-binding cassette domain-containing protein [Polaromonas sp.]|nr:ATP-binding cassette domain-containing protein [Polaromonas sp.]